MANHQHLFHYIKDKSRSGFSKDQIKTVLLEVGWEDGILEEVFILVEEKEKKRKKSFRKVGLIISIFLILAILFFSFLIYQKNKMNEKLYLQQEETKIQKEQVDINPNLSQQEYVEKLYGKERIYSATTSSSTIQN
jgi:amino acid permease